MNQIKLKQLPEGTYRLGFDDMMKLLTAFKPYMDQKLTQVQAELLTVILGKLMNGELTFEQIKPANMLLAIFDYEVIT